jgi:fatty-acyl-CoA synthase
METIEAVEKFEKTPQTEQFSYTDSYNLICQSAARFGDAIALEFILQGLRDEPSQSTSFTELSQQITRTANCLHQLGISPEDAVSIVLPILPQTHFATWGAQAAGIANPINPMLDAEQGPACR